MLALGRRASDHVELLGTCFAVRKRLLATALHIVGPDDTDLVVVRPKVAEAADYQDTSDTRVDTVPVKVVASDNFRDLCLLEIVDNSEIKFPYQISGSDETPPGNGVYIFGYPHANHGRMVFTTQPTTVGARILVSNNGVKSKYLVVNTQTRPGQSGSPVFSSTTGNVCAVVMGSYAPGAPGISLGGIDPATLHQTSHAISAEYLKDMIL
ncbi:serine protease [Streptomyces sp. NPDC059373]